MARCFSASRLREARLAAGIRPELLAIRIDRSVYTIHEYERGRVSPTVSTLCSLAAALGCTLDYLFVEAGDHVVA
jgi:transcriptional regulator with XRE-family HTH domain